MEGTKNRFARGAGLPNGPAAGVRPQRPGEPLQSSLSPPPMSSPAQMTRAERFEDEKKRIVESCFLKTDETGSAAESYITHIRVTEDASYPQTPHPPDSSSANRKERMIIVAVRNTGRVRMHKARENTNGTFSIGKTWNLEDLSAVQSWQFYNPRSAEEEQLKTWAGEIGFTVTLAKPYYWQAGTSKEKEFFVASLVKIYKKYTSGKVPDLIGFPQRDVEAMVGTPQGRGPSGSPQRAPPPFSPGRGRGPSTGERGPLSSPEMPLSPGPQTPDSMSNQSMTPSRGGRMPALNAQDPGFRAASAASSAYAPASDSRQPRQVPSRDQIRPLGGMVPDRLTPQSSTSDFRQRDGTPDSLNVSGRQVSRNSPEGRSPSRAGGEEPAGPNGLGILSPTSDRWKANGSPAPRPSDETPRSLRTTNGNAYDSGPTIPNGSQVVQQDQALPERRRPPMAAALSNGSQTSFIKSPTSQNATPLMSPALRRDAPAAASNESLSGKQMPGGFYPSPAASEQVERDGLLPAPLSPKPKQEEVLNSAPEPMSKPVPEPSPAVKPPTEEETKEQERKDAEEAARPGLGRMFGGNKKTARDLFKTAANAYGAFVPRAGGAGARILGAPATAKSPDEPDGISGVVPAPGLLARTQTNESMRSEQTQGSIQQTPTSAKASPGDQVPDPIPQVTVSSPLSPQKDVDRDMALEKAIEQDPPQPAATIAAQVKAKIAEEEAARRKKRRSAQQAKYLSILGVDAAVIDNRGLEFESLLDDFGWGTSVFHSKSIDVLETDIRREISRVEAGSWLGHLEQKDDRVEAVENLLDKAIMEVDELEGLLTLYTVELSSLNEDIAFIEAQSQGLQVQTANQKLLQTELHNLVDTISITPRQLEPLKRASPGSPDGLESIERALLVLYKAMITIDPTIRHGNAAPGPRASLSATNELSSMSALQEKSDQYLGECAMFLQRLTQFLGMQFGAAFIDTLDYIKKQNGGSNTGTKLSIEAHDIARASLWQYGPLLLFAKEIDEQSWNALLKAYQTRAHPVYQSELRDNIMLWMKMARKPTGDEQELLFTFNEKEETSSIAGNARKMTVKRSQTLARGLRTASGEKSRAGNAQSGTLWPFEAFAGALEEAIPLISAEQNFIVDLFSATGMQTVDFADAVTATPPEGRRGTDLYTKKPVEPDRDMARRVAEGMSDVYSFYPTELQNLMDWAIKSDPLQGIGILHALHRAIASFDYTNQDFLIRTLTTLATQLNGLWNKFVEDQIRAVEETKVKIKKRKGVINFIKIFPNFSAAIENMLPSAIEEPAQSSEVRAMVDTAYQKINKAMFESLRIIAKESPAMMVGGAVQPLAGDPEDKEALNYHILLIENMNHYVEEVDERNDSVLAEGRAEAREEMGEHLGMYVDAVIRRPLGKVIDFIETLDHTLSTLPPGTPPSALSTRPSTSHSTFRKLLLNNDIKELRRGIDALRKRVDKHFGDSDDPSLSRGLVGKVLLACEDAYAEVFRRVQDMGREVYEGEEGNAILGTREELGRWFRGGR